ncbi:MAG: cation transporter [Verrucomicrobiales bacterium]|nr:cation transporter [Verrucomicrobiales bacterium]
MLSRYAWLSIAAAVATFVLKLAAWRITGSVGMLSDALESIVNLAAAMVTLASLHVAAQPADDEHAYGHTKVEYFAGGIEGVLVIVAAVGIGWSAVDRFLHPQNMEALAAGIGVSCAAALINIVVARILASAGKRHHSVALQADARHLMTDVWTTISVLAALLLVGLTGWDRIDPVLGVLLAMHIVATGVKLIREAMLGLMDTGLPPDDIARIRAVLDHYAAEGIRYHALRTRQAARRRFMSVHVLVPGEWTVNRAHALVEDLEAGIRRAVPRLTIMTHLEPLEDPASWEDVELDRVQKPESAP